MNKLISEGCCNPGCLFGECANTYKCSCTPGYSGPTCTVENQCPFNCTHGYCSVDGNCNCDKNYDGIDCSQFNYPIQNSSTDVPKIVGIVIGVFSFVVIAIVALILILKKFSRKNGYQRLSDLDNSDLGEIEIQEKLGSGNFGDVYKGIWNGATVALKSIGIEEGFNEEVGILRDLRHPSIVSFYGIYKDKDEQRYMVMEFIPDGNLLNLLEKRKSVLNLNDLIGIIKSIAIGMNYLETQKILHRDLAARNILVHIINNEYRVKVSDFGMSKRSQSYKTRGKSLPIAWTAPEVLQMKEASSKSDVYSFGVLMWEIFEYGKEPWEEFNDTKKLISHIINKNTLPKPDICPLWLSNIMKECFEFSPELRPSFGEIIKKIESSWNKEDIKKLPKKPKKYLDLDL